MTSNKENPKKDDKSKKKPKWGQGDKRLNENFVAKLSKLLGVKKMTDDETKKETKSNKWGVGDSNISVEIKEGKGQEKKTLWVSRDLEDK